LKGLLSSELKDQKILIFSESKETAQYVRNELEKFKKHEIGYGHGGLTKSTTGEYEKIKSVFLQTQMVASQPEKPN